MSFMKYRFAIPKVTGTWECANPDGVTPSVKFELDETGLVNGKLTKYTATARAEKCNEGRSWKSSVCVHESEVILRCDYHHQKPEGSGMTDEITDFCAMILWSLWRADQLRDPQTKQKSPTE